MRIFILRNKESYGPYTKAELDTFLIEKRICVDDLAWTDGLENWMPLRDVLQQMTIAPPSPIAPTGHSQLIDSNGHQESQTSISEDVMDRPAAQSDGLSPEVVVDGEPTLTTGRSDNKSDPATLARRAERRARSRQSLARMRRLAAPVAAVFTSAILILILTLPLLMPQIERDSRFLLVPAPGYVWRQPERMLDLRTTWHPETLHPRIANVMASPQKEQWIPKPGYSWVDPLQQELGVAWSPGWTSGQLLHLVAADQEGQWLVDLGYSWSSSSHPERPEVVWQSKRRFPAYPHVETSTREGMWSLDPGYIWAENATTNNPAAVWSPNLAHPSYAHVVSSQKEGAWAPESGYEFVNFESSTDWRVMRPERTVAVWNTMRQIDGSATQRFCSQSSETEGIKALRAAREGYRGLNLVDVHPDLVAHAQNWQNILGSMDSALGKCILMEQGRDVGFSLSDLVAFGGCMLFSDSPDCYKDSEILRKGGEILEVQGCYSVFRSFKQPLQTLDRSRSDLHTSLNGRYSLQLAPPIMPLKCNA